MQELTKRPREVDLFKQKFVPVEPGQNILLKTSSMYSLMKYEGYEIEIERYNLNRINRYASIANINTPTGVFLFTETAEERRELASIRQREWKRHKGNIYGTHRLDFIFDEEFEIFLPSSTSQDMFLTLARETAEGEIVPREEVVVVLDSNLIKEEMRAITRPKYFESVIMPFLSGKPTTFKAPRWTKGLFKKVNLSTLQKRFEKATRNFKTGSFVYVGCKEEVHLLGLSRGDDGKPYMKGTFLTSTKPMFYFSNGYLLSNSKCEKGDDDFDIVKYNIPSSDESPFIFPQMGRFRNTIFTGEPQVITDSVSEALDHFATTDFAEFADIVEEYARQIEVIHPSSGEPDGRFYY